MPSLREQKKNLEEMLADESRNQLDRVMDVEIHFLLREVNRGIQKMTPCEYCKEKGCVDAECLS